MLCATRHRSVALFAGTLQSATFNLETLRKRAGENFITVTELADTIVRRENLPFSVAHKIVGIASKPHSRKTVKLHTRFCRRRQKKFWESELSLSKEDLQKTLSPENFVAIRTIYGGTAPEETRRALNVERDYESTDENWFSEKVEVS